MPADLRSRQPAGRFVSVHVDDLDRVPLDHGEWRPVRRPLDITGFSANAYSGREAGDWVIEPHDEGSAGSGRHEELYVVLAGAASFTIGDEVVDAPTGTLVFVPPGVHRQATAAAPRRPCSSSAASPAPRCPSRRSSTGTPPSRPTSPATTDGRRRSPRPASADWPDNAGLNYQLACYLALAGEPEPGAGAPAAGRRREPARARVGGHRPRPRRHPRRSGLAPLARPRPIPGIPRGSRTAAPTLYGRGPSDQPYLYNHAVDPSRTPTTRSSTRGTKLRLGNLVESRGTPTAGPDHRRATAPRTIRAPVP